ncbi:hypothetical protein ACWGK9_36390, partial [Streptomyces rubiginosohelvolus]
KHAHYIALIKGNHPTLHRWLKVLPWREVPLQDKARATAHGRDEIRRTKAATVTGIPLKQVERLLNYERKSDNSHERSPCPTGCHNTTCGQIQRDSVCRLGYRDS